MGKAKQTAIVFFAIAFFAFPAYAQIYLGTVDGYIFYMNNSLVTSANVSASVSGCSGSGCSGLVLSQSNGYYVIANLNLPVGGTITVNSMKANASGSNSGTADSFQAARVNVTLCEPPSVPSLIDQNDTHNSTVTLYWTSGTDPMGFSTYDQYQLDSGSIVTSTSPKTEIGLSFSSHTWKARTCNTNGATGCCSAFASDSFDVYNNPPTAPVLVPVNSSHNTTAVFSWTSGTDPDGDSTFDQFQLDSGAIINATSPKTETNLTFQSHTWKARTCDVLGACSSFSQDTFSVGNSVPSAPVLTDQLPTNQSSVSLNWTSGTDSDNDAVRDEFQFSIYSDFSVLASNITNASHPVGINNLSTLTIYYWRVRSCDFSGCSGWAADDFFTYPLCPATPPSGGCGGGGGGGGGGTGVFCIPNWECGQWGRCENGVIRRNCNDRNNCFQIPEIAMNCKIKAEEKEAEKEFYLGDLSSTDIVSKKAPLDKKWVFRFKRANYTIEITGASNNSVEFLFAGIPISLKRFESSAIDIEGDGTDDLLFMLDDLKISKGEATVSLLKTINERGQAIENPFSYLAVRERWGWLWFFVIIFELVIILYYYYKTQNLLRHAKK